MRKSQIFFEKFNYKKKDVERVWYEFVMPQFLAESYYSAWRKTF